MWGLLGLLLAVLWLARSDGRGQTPVSARTAYADLCRRWLVPGALLLLPQHCQAGERGQSGFYEARVRSLEANSYRPGVKGRDVFYPRWLEGTWSTNSTLVEVAAPLGLEVFGGQFSYEKARRDIGSSLLYKTKFIDDFEDQRQLISDRFANVEGISKAALGPSTKVIAQNSERDFPSSMVLRLLPPEDRNPLRITLEGEAIRSPGFVFNFPSY